MLRRHTILMIELGAIFTLLVLLIMPAEAYRLTLKEAVITAVEKNVSVALSRIDVGIATQKRVAAEGAFDPALVADYSRYHSRLASASAFADPPIEDWSEVKGSVALKGSAITGATYSAEMNVSEVTSNSRYVSLNPTYRGQLALSLTQPLLAGGGTTVAQWEVLSGRHTEETAAENLRAELATIVTNVTESYWDLAYYKKALASEEESLDRARDVERRVRLQVKIGSLPQLSTVEAEASRAERERLVIEARNKYERAGDELVKLINPDEESPLFMGIPDPVDDPSTSVEQVDIDTSVPRALKNRPELAAARAELKKAAVELVYYEDRLWPTLDLYGTLAMNGIRGRAQPIPSFTSNELLYSDLDGNLGDTYGDVFKGRWRDVTVGVSFSYPLGNRTARANAAAAHLRSEAAIIKLHDLERQIMLEVRNAVRDITYGVKAVEAAHASRVLAEKRLEAEMRRFEAGSSTSFRLLEYQKDLTRQQSQDLLAVADQRKAAARYRQAIGAVLTTYSLNGH